MSKFNIGDRVRVSSLPDFTWRERDAMEGKEGVITEDGGYYYTVRLDEDVNLTVKNDHLLRADEIEPVICQRRDDGA